MIGPRGPKSCPEDMGRVTRGEVVTAATAHGAPASKRQPGSEAGALAPPAPESHVVGEEGGWPRPLGSHGQACPVSRGRQRGRGWSHVRMQLLCCPGEAGGPGGCVLAGVDGGLRVDRRPCRPLWAHSSPPERWTSQGTRWEHPRCRGSTETAPAGWPSHRAAGRAKMEQPAREADGCGQERRPSRLYHGVAVTLDKPPSPRLPISTGKPGRAPGAAWRGGC